MTSLDQLVPTAWRPALEATLLSESFKTLDAFVARERNTSQVFPPEAETFTALALTPLTDVKVVILGQDPYHDDGQAHGLAFSVKAPCKPPPSLKNMFKELQTDLAIAPPSHGDLTSWAQQGVLLLNTVLTVRAHEAASHQKRGWEAVTDAVITAVNHKNTPVVFCLWGAHAHKKAPLVDETRHVVLKSAHPSPLSARLFFGSQPFSKINAALVHSGQTPIDWRLP